jgi:hypothetical protein
MHMGTPVCKRVGIAKKFTYGDPVMHNEVVCIWGLTYFDLLEILMELPVLVYHNT